VSVDTRDKRFSMIGLAKPFVRLLANPTGTIGQASRQAFVFLYTGILASGPIISVAFQDLTTLFCAHLVTLRMANGGRDLTTLVSAEIPIVRASDPADLNTAFEEFLN
jgi:hypothetical protein